MSNNFFFPENHAVLEVVWKNIVGADTPQVAILRMRIVCSIPKATNTHSICNTYWFFTVTLVARTRPSVTSYVPGLSCFWLRITTQFVEFCLHFKCFIVLQDKKYWGVMLKKKEENKAKGDLKLPPRCRRDIPPSRNSRNLAWWLQPEISK